MAIGACCRQLPASPPGSCWHWVPATQGDCSVRLPHCLLVVAASHQILRRAPAPSEVFIYSSALWAGVERGPRVGSSRPSPGGTSRCLSSACRVAMSAELRGRSSLGSERRPSEETGLSFCCRKETAKWWREEVSVFSAWLCRPAVSGGSLQPTPRLWGRQEPCPGLGGAGLALHTLELAASSLGSWAKETGHELAQLPQRPSGHCFPVWAQVPMGTLPRPQWAAVFPAQQLPCERVVECLGDPGQAP